MNMMASQIDRFDLGLDLVSSLSDVPDGATPNALNMRVNERGGVEKVRGYSAHATLAADAHSLTSFKHRDGSPNVLVAATATAIYSIDSGGSPTAIDTGRTSESDTSFAEYEDELYILGPSNDLAVWNGTTVTDYAPGVNSGPKRGTILGVWDNRLWVTPGGLRVEWSEAGLLTGTGAWPTTNFIELGGPGSTEEIVGAVPMPGGLVVFTTGSTYRIYDAVNQLSTVVDPGQGCSSRRSLAVIDGRIFGMCQRGLFASDGSSPHQIISEAVRPLFSDETPTLSAAAGVGRYGAYLCSYQRDGSANDLTLEVSPSGAIMANQYPALDWASSDMEGEPEAYFIDASDPTRIRHAFDGGSFAGSDIECYYDLSPSELGVPEQLKRLRRARVVGRGDMYIGAIVDYATNPESLRRLGLGGNSSTATWDNVTWDNAVWGGYGLFEGHATLNVRGRTITLRLWERGNSTAASRDLLGASTGDALGGAAFYVVEPQFHISTRRR